MSEFNTADKPVAMGVGLEPTPEQYFNNVKTFQVGAGAEQFKITNEGMWLGATTFSAAPFSVSPAGVLTASSGTFSGTLSAPSGTLGTVTGGIIQTAATGYRVKLNGTNNKLEFLNDDTVLGSAYASSGGDVIINATDDVNMAIGGTITCSATSGSFKPNSDKTYHLGSDANQWGDVYGTTFYGGATGSGGTTEVAYGLVNGIRSDTSDATKLEYRFAEMTVQGGIVTTLSEGSWHNIPEKS